MDKKQALRNLINDYKIYEISINMNRKNVEKLRNCLSFNPNETSANFNINTEILDDEDGRFFFVTASVEVMYNEKSYKVMEILSEVRVENFEKYNIENNRKDMEAFASAFDFLSEILTVRPAIDRMFFEIRLGAKDETFAIPIEKLEEHFENTNYYKDGPSYYGFDGFDKPSSSEFPPQMFISQETVDFLHKLDGKPLQSIKKDVVNEYHKIVLQKNRDNDVYILSTILDYIEEYKDNNDVVFSFKIEDSKNDESLPLFLDSVKKNSKSAEEEAEEYKIQQFMNELFNKMADEFGEDDGDDGDNGPLLN